MQQFPLEPADVNCWADNHNATPLSAAVAVLLLVQHGDNPDFEGGGKLSHARSSAHLDSQSRQDSSALQMVHASVAEALGPYCSSNAQGN